MRRSAVSLLLVLFAIDIFGAVIEQRGESSGPILSRDGNAVALDGQSNPEKDANFPQHGSDSIDENAVDVNSPLLSDENDHNHPHHSTAEKHKRCPSYRVGSALKSRSGIVGAESPQPLERRDLQSQFYERMCTTCMSRHACNAVSECPLCEKWCTKVPDNEESPTDRPKEQNGPIVSPNLDEPIVSMASRSNFDDDNRKNVYNIAILRTGNEKEMILKVLGVSGTEDIDSVVVWVTTNSNNPPLLPNGFQAEPVQDAERFVNNIRNQKQIAPIPIVGEPNPASSRIMNSEIPVATDILPRYPIDSNPNGFIVHQSLNPDIIEGPPSMMANGMDGEKIAGTELLGSPTKEEQPTMSYQDTPTDVLLGEENQPSLQSIDQSRMAQNIPANQPSEANMRLPMQETNVSPSATIDKILANTNQLTPGSRMREFLENVKANRDNAKNSILSRKITGINNGSPVQNQIEPITSNLQNRAKEAMDKFKSIQIPTSFQRFNNPDANNIVSSDHMDPNEISKFSEDASKIHHGHNIPHGHGHHLRISEQEDNKSMNSQTNEAVNPEMNLEARNDFTGDGSDNDISDSQSRTSHGKGHGHSHGHGHGHGHGHHHRTSEQGEVIDSQEATNDMMMERNGMGTLGSQNIDPKRIMEFSPDEDTFNPQSRSYQSQDVRPANGQTIGEKAMTEGSMGTTDEKSSLVKDSLSGLDATENEVTGMENPIEPEQIQISPVGSLEPNPVVDPQPSVSKKPDGVGIVKMKLGARTNELLQKIRDKQDAMKHSLLGNKKSLNAASGDSNTPAINNSDKADDALGAVQDITDELPQGEGSQQAAQTPSGTVSYVPELTIDKITPETERFPQMVGQPEIVGSQPLEDSFERIQPFMSRSGRPWHNHISNLDTARDEKPSLGSTNLNQLDDPRVMKDGGDLNLESRGQFEQIPVSNALGAIIPGQKEMEISFQKPSDIYFIGNGIKLPLQMMKKADGAVHFSVDMEKLCSCNNASCPKNHTDIEKTVETILEKEAELKDQLVHTAQDFVDKPRSDIDTRNQPTLGQQFENMSPLELNSQQDKMGDMAVRMAAPPNMIRPTAFHRDQRDTARKFLEMKNSIASNFDSTELQSDGADILKRSLVEKNNSTGTPKLDIVRSTIKPVLQKDSMKITEAKPQRKSIENTSKMAPHDIKKDHNTNNHMPNVTKETVTQTTASYFQNLLGKTLDEFKAKMSDLEKRNQVISKDLGLPQNLLGNIWKDSAVGTTENSNRLSIVQSTPQNLSSRIQEIVNKSVKKDLELYDNLASITKPYKFKNLEKKMENTINHYTKTDDKIVKDESATLQSMLTEDPVIKREVGIASNLLKFFKDLASEKGK